jgi:hypothetical protein
MQDNDLSSAPTRRIWVLSDVVLDITEEEVEERRWFRYTSQTKRIVGPDLGALSRLWRWSSSVGLRLELIFVSEPSAPEVMDMLDRGAANPFSDYHVFEFRKDVANVLPYRPDIAGVIDSPEYTAMYGGRGLLLEVVR